MIQEAGLEDAFGPTRLEQLRPSEVVGYRTRMLDDGFAAASVARDLAILHSFLDWATMKEYVPRNVSDGVPYPKAAQREGTPLTPAQVQRLLPAFDDEQARIYFLLLVLSGVRRAEAQALRWADVDQVDQVIRVRKSKTRTGVRSIAIVPALADALAEHRNRSPFQGDDEYVFCNPETGSKYRASVFKLALEAACTLARVDLPDGFRPQHDLRVTSITSDAIAGATPTALKSKAGHSSMATTERYVKLAGVVFRSEATAQAARLLGRPSTNSLPDSPDLSEPNVARTA
ncbi:MAG: tyrosine-type recombinase/integrase [Gaiellaceae bacterium]